MLYLAGWDHLVSWKPDFSGYEPNVAENCEVNADATEYTFYLRKGMKWSDSEPFTADYIMFYLEDIIGNEELLPGHTPIMQRVRFVQASSGVKAALARKAKQAAVSSNGS